MLTRGPAHAEEQIASRGIVELAAQIDADYAGRDLLLVGVLKGAVMVMADLSRALTQPVEMDWMAISSYGSGTKSSGVVRILKDLDQRHHRPDVLVVEDIIDSGLTLSYLSATCRPRARPASRSARCSASRRRPSRRPGAATSASTSRTSSSSATAWTTRSATATCRRRHPRRRTSTAESDGTGPGRRTRCRPCARGCGTRSM